MRLKPSEKKNESVYLCVQYGCVGGGFTVIA